MRGRHKHMCFLIGCYAPDVENTSKIFTFICHCSDLSPSCNLLFSSMVVQSKWIQSAEHIRELLTSRGHVYHIKEFDIPIQANIPGIKR